MDRDKIGSTNRILVNKINQKIDYLTAIRSSIVSGDILRVYQLLDSARFNKYVKKYQHADSNVFLSAMTKQIQPEIANFLSTELISYINHQLPLFRLEEINLGVYAVYIGDWWQRRQIGLLDVIRAEFIFDGYKLDQIKASFDLKENQSIHDTEIDDMQKQIEAYREKNLKGHAEKIDQLMRQRQKEAKILKLEVDEIKKYFESYQEFAERTSNLYQEYLNGMINVNVTN